MKSALISLTLMFLVEGSAYAEEPQQKPRKVPMLIQLTENCISKMEEYDYELKWNDIRYMWNRESDTSELEKGKKIAEVSLKLGGNVCPGYRIQNGDATWAEIGTPISQVKGYDERFRLFVGDDLYQAMDGPDAKTMGDLFDVAGKVKKVKLEYTKESQDFPYDYEIYSADFSAKDSVQFAESFVNLDYIPFEEMYKNRSHNRESEYVVRFYLHDNSSFSVLYWLDENAFTRGYGDDTIKRIVENYVDRLQKVERDPEG
ncbi:hypothetical protein J31TS6_04590 [Brevibacillus reuszeri]|uniref:hypothetical protein n=1 Tax=Brevibacillus reuszeri TaxID=54915 RepID=UPI001B2EFFCA|nr:hypothetical protein [Brevibacillus reuszeri]GIO04431.1 hypothetical protein J31TS6_04590 [Brevibacillus reuszeri]